MLKLYAAADETLDGEYVAFVVGDAAAIQRNIQVLPENFRHMTSLEEYEKKVILRNLDFRGNIMVWCMHFGLPSLDIQIKNILAAKKSRQQGKTIKNKIAYAFIRQIDFAFADFVGKYDQSVADLEFEVDNAVIKGYFSDSGRKTREPNDAHMIADCVAHANGHHWRIRSKVNESKKDFNRSFTQHILEKIL